MSKKRPGGHPARAGQSEDAAAARRAEAAALRQQELARERSRRVLLVSAAVVVVLALVAVVVVLVVRQGDDTTTEGATPPSATAPDGGYLLAGDAAPGAPTLDVWLDYQCPFCADFEAAAGDDLQELAASGQARVVVHTLSFLDENLGNDSSTRAAQGAAAADVQGRFAEYSEEVFARQPGRAGNDGAEGDGYTDEQLRAAAQAAGVGDLDAWEQAVADDTHLGYVRRVQASMADAGVEGTPTVQLTPDGGETRALETGQLLGADAGAYLREQVARATEAAAS
ncbi:DsbA family protein [Paenibacillus sp. TRM 82003]|uniref:DsbA family protein n=1 Tax=Kineococcus sp. TRM81007 TaxID=2925831 RepID=UPI001F5767FD|nr:thioredoxin domain-containing protein [Kineococcus sp. TRM81007]MCI2239083.1 DsbA family protein [Kineococcus sp. TRM81007]MCI3924502.1 DsbA family protein [Paenibacillus sp. TRM 82003]